MAVAVPGERRDAVAELDPLGGELLGDAHRAAANVAIVRAMDRAFDQARHDLAVGMLDGGEIDDLVDQQRPILHQTQHEFPPVPRRLAALGASSTAFSSGPQHGAGAQDWQCGARSENCPGAIQPVGWPWPADAARAGDGGVMNSRAEDLAMRVWFRFMRLETRMQIAVTERLREIGLSVPQCDVLTTLTEAEGVSQQDLAKRLYVTKGNISGLLDRLENAGLVERRSTAVRPAPIRDLSDPLGPLGGRKSHRPATCSDPGDPRTAAATRPFDAGEPAGGNSRPHARPRRAVKGRTLGNRTASYASLIPLPPSDMTRPEEMTAFRTARRVRHAAAEMFDLVADFERYPEFVPFCRAARITRRTQGADGIETLIADMEVSQPPLRQRFTTRDTLDRARNKIHMDYVDGPFRAFENIWSFHDEEAGGCRVEFFAEYEFRSRTLEILMGSMFQMAYRGIADAFVERANVVYGRRAPIIAR